MANLSASFEQVGIRLTSPLREVLQRHMAEAYQAGAASHRELCIEWLKSSQEGRLLLRTGGAPVEHDDPTPLPGRPPRKGG